MIKYKYPEMRSWFQKISLAILLLHLNVYTLSLKHFQKSYHHHHHHQTSKSKTLLRISPSILNTYSVPIESYRTPEDVGEALCRQFVEKAKVEIASKGNFNVCVPGGSAVKLLKYLKPYKDLVDWSKVYLFYVNHKCVPDNDESATHFKAKNIFIDHVGLTNVFVPDSTKPTATETAASYATTLEAKLPKKNGLPYFDLVILGMGKDGHIGSLYPGREEVNEQSALVLSVDKVCMYVCFF